MIDLCIVNYNSFYQLKRLLSWLEPFSPKDFKIYIADNGSTDGAREALEPAKDFYKEKSDIDLVFNENIGYAAACNQLAAMGTGDIIGLLNADVWMTKDDITLIQKSFDDNPHIAILGPKQRDEKGYITHAGISGDETTARPRGWKLHDPDDIHYRHLEPMVSVAGSAYFIRRTVWNDLTQCGIYQASSNNAQGAFLPTPHYYEETFCSYHARAHGYYVFYDGRISIGHSWHASHEIGSEHDRMFNVSREIFRKACDDHKIAHD